ncbi:hypothetical protein ACNAN0_11765 [Agrilactobacillus fermenti]|uniref:hypothetical protein n=1 Tax=Agrilactobacillus fermenti TaxID=2586909 RepID=UPI003A5BF555
MNNEALIQQLKMLQKKAPAYETRALYQETIILLKAQARRIEQAEAEIDGRTWNHETW